MSSPGSSVRGRRSLLPSCVWPSSSSGCLSSRGSVILLHQHLVKFVQWEKGDSFKEMIVLSQALNRRCSTKNSARLSSRRVGPHGINGMNLGFCLGT